MSSKVAVVIPNHKEELDEFEKISLAQVRKVLEKYPIIFALPAGKKFSFLRQDDNVIYFPPQFFQNVKAYNILMMSPNFYAAFRAFDYILIHELDAFVFRDELEYFCSLGYDYIGAPWPFWLEWLRNTRRVKSRVGNSGFCLRNVKAHYNLLAGHSEFVNKFLGSNNDDFFSRCGQTADLNFHVAPYNVACKFSAEVNPERVVKKNGGKLPFGCHAWFKFHGNFYAPILQQSGYDLRPLKNKIRTLNYKEILRKGLTDEATERLIRRLQRGQSIGHYLPAKRFASVRVIRHPPAMMILARLLLENNALADEVFFYDPDEQDLLLQDLTLQKLPHLLIHFGGGIIMI